MDFKKLQYFLTVAEEGHITRAAEKLHIAQPPLSRQIKAFENELGVQLVEKVGRQIRITKVGQALQDRGEQILDLVDKTVKELQEIEQGLQGTLSIGSVPAWGATFLPARMVKFKQQYPFIRFRLWEGSIQRITELLHNGVIEIGILRFPVDAEKYESLTLPGIPIIAAMTADWVRDGDAGGIGLLDFADRPLLLHHRSKARIEKYYRSNGVEPDIACVQEDVRSMLALADAGLGVALVPQIAVHLVQSANLIFQQITEPKLEIISAVAWMKNRYISTAAKRFLATFSEDDAL